MNNNEFHDKYMYKQTKKRMPKCSQCNVNPKTQLKIRKKN